MRSFTRLAACCAIVACCIGCLRDLARPTPIPGPTPGPTPVVLHDPADIAEAATRKLPRMYAIYYRTQAKLLRDEAASGTKLTEAAFFKRFQDGRLNAYNESFQSLNQCFADQFGETSGFDFDPERAAKTLERCADGFDRIR